MYCAAEFTRDVEATLNVLWLPVFLLLAIVAALGFGLWLQPRSTCATAM